MRPQPQQKDKTMMHKGQMKLYWDETAKRNWMVELIEKVQGGWLVRLPSDVIVGPVKEGAASLR
jgi:hypothetical protein